MMMYQIGALQGFCRAHSVRLTQYKAYNMAVKNTNIADAIVLAIRDCTTDSGLLASFGSQIIL